MREVVIDGGVDNGVGLLCASAQGIEIVEILTMRFGTCRRQKSRASIGSRQPQNLMPGCE